MSKIDTFSTIEELIRFIAENNHTIENLNISVTVAPKPLTESTVVEPAPILEDIATTVAVSVRSLSDAPTVTATIGEQNVLYVKNIQEHDSTRVLTVEAFGRRIMFDKLRENEEFLIKLDIDIGDKVVYAVPFAIRESTDGDAIQINRDMLND